MSKARKKVSAKAITPAPKMGRPSKFDAIDINQVKMLAEHGHTDKFMANFFGVAESTWTRWKLKHKDFCASLKTSKAVADQEVERSLYERATGYSHPQEKIFVTNGAVTRVETTRHCPPDVTACIFWLKNRKPAEWRDRRKHEQEGNSQSVIEIILPPGSTPEQIKAIADWQGSSEARRLERYPRHAD